MDSQHSVTQLFSDLKNGDELAAAELAKRYLDRMIGVGRATYYRKLDNIPRPAEDEEDAALSALDSFIDGAREGKFAQLQDRNNLWGLLVKITVRKVYDQRQRALAKKRGGGATVTAELIDGIVASSEQPSVANDELPPRRRSQSVEQLIDDLPGPQAAAELADTYRVAVESLEDSELRQIAEMELAGTTKEEIAVRLGVTERTVYRKLDVIHELWDHRFADVS